MKNSLLTIAILSLGMGNSLYAQQNEASETCSKQRVRNMALAKTTVADPAEDAYDMKYVKIDVSLNNTSTDIAGNVTTRAKVLSASLPAYVFELNANLDIDSVRVNGQTLSWTTSGSKRTVTLPSPLLQNANFIARVWYHGQPASGNGFFSEGLNNVPSPSWGNLVTYTLSEPYEAKDWWPAKQSLTDKIDSADIWITVPSGLKAGSNGLLKNVTSLPNSFERYEWSTGYPIDYYLISAAVSSYVDYSFYVHFPGSQDSMLVQNYVYDNPQTLPFFKDKIDSVGNMIKYFSTLYGRYPFWKEKYGHCMAPIGGGMEHQTMTTLGNFSTTLSVHELGHQWFGDNVTCASWKDIWLNEGFAAYTEYLYVAKFRNAVKAFNYMADVHDNVMSEPDGSIYVDDTTDENRIFDSRLSYDKGSSVVHMLRFLANDDTLFFKGLRAYQQQFGKSTASITDMKHVMSQTLAANLDTFFNQWIYGEGFPRYETRWNQAGNKVYVQLTQSTTVPSSVPLYHTPVEIRLVSATGDTTIRVENDQNVQGYLFNWDQTVVQVELDPNDWLLNGDLGSVQDQTLGFDGTAVKQTPAVYPNPATKSWTITGLSASNEYELHTIDGALVAKGVCGKEMELPAAKLVSGIYFLGLRDDSGIHFLKLLKQ